MVGNFTGLPMSEYINKLEIQVDELTSDLRLVERVYDDKLSRLKNENDRLKQTCRDQANEIALLKAFKKVV